MSERPNVTRLSGHRFSWTVLCHGSDPPSLLRLHTKKALGSGRRCQKVRPAHNRAIRATHCPRSHFEAAPGLLSKHNESENKTCLIEYPVGLEKVSMFSSEVHLFVVIAPNASAGNGCLRCWSEQKRPWRWLHRCGGGGQKEREGEQTEAI